MQDRGAESKAIDVSLLGLRGYGHTPDVIVLETRRQDQVNFILIGKEGQNTDSQLI